MSKKKKKKIKKTKSKLPNNISEEDFLIAIDNVAKKLGHKFKFGYHSFEDMKQQATIFALECLDKYDKSRPLENFLWTHVRNRLFNYKRDNYQRPDKPCLKCPEHDPSFSCSTSACKAFNNKSDCELYRLWEKRNNNKKNIMSPQYIEDNHPFRTESNVLSDIANKEILDLIDKQISPSDRAVYLKIKHGQKISSIELNKLKETILNIVNKHYDNT
jgi:hypothetical protein